MISQTGRKIGRCNVCGARLEGAKAIIGICTECIINEDFELEETENYEFGYKDKTEENEDV
ncbi:MAG TPA: hypothetical protein ACFYEK_10975 [Candidatus Wunengus sp. YC60]|uniref:hypothetical protein n=1 Tax=Candidatus Wunengus sp. YC60 TaxID=3367697 RepID=UPI00402500A6